MHFLHTDSWWFLPLDLCTSTACAAPKRGYFSVCCPSKCLFNSSLCYPWTCLLYNVQQPVLSLDVQVLQQPELQQGFYTGLTAPSGPSDVSVPTKPWIFSKYFFFMTKECKDDIQEPLTRTWSHCSVRGAVAVGEQAGRLVTDVSLRYSLDMN